MMQIENSVLIRHFIRCDATGNHLQFLALRTMHTEVLWHVHNFLLGGQFGQKKIRKKAIQRFYCSGIHGEFIIWWLNVMSALKLNVLLESHEHLWMRCQLVHHWTAL